MDLDLVVTVDTSVAHLAGALGRPAWVLLARGSDWNWLREREDSPWYPTLRLFRQGEREKWPEVMARVQAALPDMRKAKEGAIIVISSIGGLRGSQTIGAYNISKAADFQLVRNLAAEYGKYNVRVNAIAPGLIRTDFARALWENVGVVLRRDPQKTH